MNNNTSVTHLSNEDILEMWLARFPDGNPPNKQEYINMLNDVRDICESGFRSQEGAHRLYVGVTKKMIHKLAKDKEKLKDDLKSLQEAIERHQKCSEEWERLLNLKQELLEQLHHELLKERDKK